jgi:hypothetical protein
VKNTNLKGSIRSLTPLVPADEQSAFPILTAISQGVVWDGSGSRPRYHGNLATISVEPLTATPDTFDALMERRLMGQLREQLVNQGLYCGIDASRIPQWRCNQIDLGGASLAPHLERVIGMLLGCGGLNWFLLRHGTLGDTSQLGGLDVYHHPDVPATEAWVIAAGEVVRIGTNEADPCMAILLTTPFFSAIVHNVGEEPSK